MTLPAFVHELLATQLGAKADAWHAVSGGCINQAARVETPHGPFFVKWREASPPGFFEAEADGLARLRQTGTLRTPEVLGLGHRDGIGALILEWLPSGMNRRASMVDLGRRLAMMHSKRGLAPGLQRDNVIGALPQANKALAGERWQDFFRRQRIDALAHKLSLRVRRKLERLDLSSFVLEPEGGCALLHGDLWGGNVLCAPSGEGWAIDPAVYQGHPEVDLAMTLLFGGFPPAFYDAYQEIAGPFDREWRERAAVLNLYPLLVHLHLFGGGYEGQIDALLERFVGET